MAYGVVYLIWNLVNDKKYVGQTTKSLKIRISRHIYDKNSLIGKAIRKYGTENFRWGIIEKCDNQEQLNEREIFWIAKLRCKTPIGYNRSDGDEGITGFTHSSKTCSKISATQRKNTPFKNLVIEIDRYQLSYTALAKLMNSTRQIISRKMHGKQNFTDTEWAKLAKVFGKPAEYLMVRDDEKKFSVSKRHSSPFKNLITEIDNRKLTYTTLAKLLDLRVVNVSQRMRGICNFSETEWAKLAEIFDKPAEYLMVRCDGLPAITSIAAKNAKISVAHRPNTQFKNLRNEIEKRQLSNNALAKIIGMSTSSVSMKMHGKKNFTAKDIAKLVEIFGKPAEYLMARE